MTRIKAPRKPSLKEKYPPSDPCTCEVCIGFCARPGWWTVAEADRAIKAGYGSRMMLEVAPELTFGVLSPAFHGSEQAFAENRYSSSGCTFLKNERCELFGTGHQPLECRFCHHDRRGLGPQCHADLEKDWNTPQGHALVVRWSKQTGLWTELKLYGWSWLKQLE